MTLPTRQGRIPCCRQAPQSIEAVGRLAARPRGGQLELVTKDGEQMKASAASALGDEKTSIKRETLCLKEVNFYIEKEKGFSQGFSQGFSLAAFQFSVLSLRSGSIGHRKAPLSSRGGRYEEVPCGPNSQAYVEIAEDH